VAVTSYYTLALPATSTSAATNTATVITSVTALVTTTIADSVATAAVNSQSGASPTVTFTLTPAAQKTKPPIGAIIGGIMGGMAVLGLIIGAIYVFFVRRRNQGQQQSYVTGPVDQRQYGQVPNANHDEEKHNGMVQTSRPLDEPYSAQPAESAVGGRLRYPDTDIVGEPQDTQNVGDLPSGRLQYRDVV
jgi:beta-lactamase regulating signal transducer with metallopeptidase domain